MQERKFLGIYEKIGKYRSIKISKLGPEKLKRVRNVLESKVSTKLRKLIFKIGRG